MIKIFLAIKVKLTTVVCLHPRKPWRSCKGTVGGPWSFWRQTLGAPVPKMLQEATYPPATEVWENMPPPCMSYPVPAQWLWRIPLCYSCLSNFIPPSIHLLEQGKLPWKYHLKPHSIHSRNQGHPGRLAIWWKLWTWIQNFQENTNSHQSDHKTSVLDQIQRWYWDWF